MGWWEPEKNQWREVECTTCVQRAISGSSTLETTQLQSSLEEKDLGVIVSMNLNMSQQWVFASKNTNNVLDFIMQSIVRISFSTVWQRHVRDIQKLSKHNRAIYSRCSSLSRGAGLDVPSDLEHSMFQWFSLFFSAGKCCSECMNCACFFFFLITNSLCVSLFHRIIKSYNNLD